MISLQIIVNYFLDLIDFFSILVMKIKRNFNFIDRFATSINYNIVYIFYPE